ncbi:MAG: indolepyruvate oxidoreductase subunit beta [Clostridiales bacterium]|nr:MAG: indolepyruvate oxidoreductase subunit beta [Clostridiales bacterium]
MKELNILIVGVGGQGTLLASVLLGNLAMNGGYDVKLSEVHGMAQRGGSVVTHVRMGEQEVCAPVIDRGGADIIVAFEMLEAYRWVEYLKKGGKLFVNRQRINPMPVIMGTAKYPDDIEGFLKREIGNVKFVDALEIAEELGNVKAVNTVLMGVLAKELPFDREEWLAQIEKTVKPRFVELNKKAFMRGYEL